VIVASRFSRANSTDTVWYSLPSALRLRVIGVSAMPAVTPDLAGSDCRASASARFTTASSSFERGAISSTRRQSTARLPFTPSSVVQNTSAWSRRTLRLSVTRVRPPVPGSTASSGSSGSDTAAEPSSTSMMWSQASASS
jgi:hypothetical protein